MSFAGLGLDPLSVGGHKIGAPADIGVFLARRGIPMTTGQPGSGHERPIRSGMPDIAGVCALGVALAEVVAERAAFASRTATLRAHLLAYLPGGTYSTVGETASPSAIIHLSLLTAHPEAVLMVFDMDGTAVFAGFTCHARVTRPSGIVMVMGYSEEQMLDALRVSLGHETTRDDVNTFPVAPPVAIHAGAALDGVAHVRDERNEEPQMGALAALFDGVGSAVVTARVVEIGHDVVGVHMVLSFQSQECRIGSHGCCSTEDAGDAARAAEIISTPFYVQDLAQEFGQTVITDFIAQCRARRAPSPYVRCNEFVKFRELTIRVRALGFGAVCTDHYAVVIDGAAGPELRHGADNPGDQSYVSVVMGSGEFHRAVLPLGDVPNKVWVCSKAKRPGLGVFNKPDSCDICFIPDGDTWGFLRAHLGVAGDEITTPDGGALGRHEGYWNYTVGQHKSLGTDASAPDEHPRHVLETRPETNQVVAGASELLSISRTTATNAVQLASDDDGSNATGLFVQLRARGVPVPVASLAHDLDTGAISVILASGAHGVARGQSMVIHRGT